MPKLFQGHLGEAVSIPGFATKMPCGKCAKIYGFATSATGKGSFVHECFSCAEDAWSLKAGKIRYWNRVEKTNVILTK